MIKVIFFICLVFSIYKVVYFGIEATEDTPLVLLYLKQGIFSIAACISGVAMVQWDDRH